jgi:hypothetical protein
MCFAVGMIQRIYSKLDLQLAALSAMLIASGLIAYVLGYVPMLRASLENLLLGITCGLLLVAFQYGFNSFCRKYRFFKPRDPKLKKEASKTIYWSEILCKGVGEETLLRGFIFIPLCTYFSFLGSTLLAFVINAALSISIYSTRDKFDYFIGIKVSVLALIYLYSYSVFALIIARLVNETALLLASHYNGTSRTI